MVQKPLSSNSGASQGNISRLLPTCQILGLDESVLRFRKLDQEGCVQEEGDLKAVQSQNKDANKDILGGGFDFFNKSVAFPFSDDLDLSSFNFNTA